jgi:predicted Rossmann fold flavoprotein
MSEQSWDVIVIGAGAAGLMAAIRAAERGRRVLLLEKNRKPGVKILMSGGTRCNLTHATDNRGIVEAFGPQGKFLHSALASLSVDETVAFFEAEGVATKVEETGKIFPVSNRATDVLAALLRRLERSGAQLRTAQPVLDLRQDPRGFAVVTPGGVLTALHVVLTTGGKSYPGSGTTGDGYGFAAAFGHQIIPPRPALVPITTSESWVAALRGITIPNVRLELCDRDKVLDARRGSLLFAHFGLSGPVVLDISRAVTGHPEPHRLQLHVDWSPPVPEQELTEFLKQVSNTSGKRQLAAILADPLPRRLCEALLVQAGAEPDRTAAGLSRELRAAIVNRIKHLMLPVTGTLGFNKAEVTAGGIALGEVDSRTTQSKKVPGLFVAGEVLDLDGPIGGYNFQAAWSTGWLAGSSV